MRDFSRGYALKPEFELEMRTKWDQLLAQRAIRNMTTQQCWGEMVAWLRPRIADARIEPSEKTSILVLCPDCKRVHKMAADVRYYRCTCTPHRDRPTWTHQRPMA